MEQRLPANFHEITSQVFSEAVKATFYGAVVSGCATGDKDVNLGSGIITPALLRHYYTKVPRIIHRPLEIWPVSEQGMNEERNRKRKEKSS